MFRNVIIRRISAVSVTCFAVGVSTLEMPGGAHEAFAQPAIPKPHASIAPKNASPAPPPASGTSTPAAVAPTESPTAPTASSPDLPAPPPPTVETPPPAAPPEWIAQWRAVYERGKAALTAGAFPIASRMLNDVALRAPDPALRMQARELAQVASYWAANRLILTPMVNTPPPTSRLEDKRSIDELAILYSNTLIWGTGFGVVIGLGSDNSSAATYILPAIGMSAIGVGALAYMDVGRGPLRYGLPQSITSGMYMGIEAGVYTAFILTAENAVHNSEKVIPGIVWGSATAGALIGGLVGATVPITPGRASFTSSGAIWGGLLTSLVTVGATDGKFSSSPFITGLIGATAGGVGTALLGDSISPSIARVRFIDVGAFAGGLVFGGFYASITDSVDGRALSFLTSAGVVAGLATSYWLTNGMDRDEPRRGNLTQSATWRATPFMTPQPGGGTLGFAGTF